MRWVLIAMVALASCGTSHECYDTTHRECDGVCECDGVECPQGHPDYEYQFYVVDDSVNVFNNGRHVGNIKLDGSLEPLINADNE